MSDWQRPMHEWWCHELENDMIKNVALSLAMNPMPGDYDEVPAHEVFSRPRYQGLAMHYMKQAKVAWEAIKVYLPITPEHATAMECSIIPET